MSDRRTCLVTALDSGCSRSHLRLHSSSRVRLSSFVGIPRRIQELGVAIATAFRAYPTRIVLPGGRRLVLDGLR